jgi:hypothetical protein
LNDVAKRSVTWLPEGLFRYLSGIPGVCLDDNEMQQCVLESILASIPVVDQGQFNELFGRRIDLAVLDFAREKEKYIASVEVNQRELEEAFEATPDIEKPLFVSQMGWKTAHHEEEKRERIEKQREKTEKELDEAKRQIKHLEQERDAGWKRRQEEVERQLAARKKNLGDPKHVRKRRRQGKNRIRRRKK